MINEKDFDIIWKGNTPVDGTQLKKEFLECYQLKQIVITAIDEYQKYTDNVENNSMDRSRTLDNAILLQSLLEQSGIPTLITDYNKTDDILPKK